MLFNKFLRSFTYPAMIVSSLTLLSSSHAMENEGNAPKNNRTTLSKFYPSGEVGILLSLGKWLSQNLESKHQCKLAADEKAELKPFEFSSNSAKLSQDIGWCGYPFSPSPFEIPEQPSWRKNQNGYWKETATTPGPKIPTGMIMAALIRLPLTIRAEYNYQPFRKPHTLNYNSARVIYKF